MGMNIVCLDLEGVLAPEIWVAFGQIALRPQSGQKWPKCFSRAVAWSVRRFRLALRRRPICFAVCVCWEG